MRIGTGTAGEFVIDGVKENSSGTETITVRSLIRYVRYVSVSRTLHIRCVSVRYAFVTCPFYLVSTSTDSQRIKFLSPDNFYFHPLGMASRSRQNYV